MGLDSAKRSFDIDMQHCPNCSAGQLKINAATLEQPVIEGILTRVGLVLCRLERGQTSKRPSLQRQRAPPASVRLDEDLACAPCFEDGPAVGNHGR